MRLGVVLVLLKAAGRRASIRRQRELRVELPLQHLTSLIMCG